MKRLLACPSCSRHVRSTESKCPFCEAALEPTNEPAATGTARLSRAALFAIGSTIAACDSPPPSPPTPPPDPQPTHTGEPRTIYGGPPPNIADAAPPAPPPLNTSPPAPAYGAPPPSVK